jgi:hypothetical protein
VPGEDEDAETNPPSLETMQSFVCYEDLFDELTEIHGVDHCKGRTFYNQCKEKYANVTQEVTKLFIDTCQLCVKSMPRKKPTPGHTPILTLGFGSRGQVDLIDFQNLPDGEFKFLMNYTDMQERSLGGPFRRRLEHGCPRTIHHIGQLVARFVCGDTTHKSIVH